MADDENTDTTAEDTEAQELLAGAMSGEDTQGTAEGEQDDLQTQLSKALAEAEKWKGLSRKHERTAKDNKSAADELAQLKDSQKTEQERLNDRLAAAEVKLAQYRTREVRNQAASEAGLPADLAEFITEVDFEPALEQAKRLAERLKPAEPARPNLMQGARPPQQQADDPNAWLRRMAGLG
jgi:hypothetical protein